MLDKLRASAHGVFGKILLALLVLSFGVWGIGDVFRSSGSINAVATIDKTPITVQEFSRALRNRQELLQMRLGKAYNPELIKRLGLEGMVRDELINSRLITTEAATLGIVIGDDEIVDTINRNPAFQDKNGKFDKVAYVTALKSRGIAEQRYVSDVRENMAARLLAETITSGVVVPDLMAQAIYKSREEQRSASVTLIPSSIIQQIPAPTESEVKSYYDVHNKEFLAPEYRALSYINLKVSAMQAKMEIPDEDVKRAYEEKVEDFRQPERRQLEQMLFDKAEDANAVAEKIAHGGHFVDLAKTAKIVNKGKTLVGLVARSDLPGEDAKEIFALKEGQTTKPLKSDFGWHIFYVSKIVAESVTPLAQARTGVIKDLSAAKAVETLTRLANQIEDDMAGGASLEDAAKKAGFKPESVPLVARDGKSPDGKKVTLPAYDNFVDTAFSVAEKDHSQAIQGSDGSYFILRVDSITPEHPRPLAEVKERITSALRAEKTAELLKKTAENIATKLHAGKKPDVALSSISSGNLKHISQTTEDEKIKLPEGLVSELFNITPHQYTSAYKAGNGEYMIGLLEKVIPAPSSPDAKTLQAIKDDLRSSLENDAMSAYFTYLRTKHPVYINNAAFSRQEDNGAE